MKNYLILIIISVSLIMQYACTETDWSYKDENFVAFEAQSVSALEGTKSFPVKLLCADNGRKETVSVTFDYNSNSDDVKEGIDFIILNESNTITFEPGQGEASIDVRILSDLELTEITESVTFSITSIDNANYQIGLIGPDSKNSECTLNMLNACLLTEGILEGSVNGAEDSPWWTASPGAYKWTFVREIEPQLIEYQVSGWFYAQLLTAYNAWLGTDADVIFHPVTVIIDNRDSANPKYSMLAGDAVTRLDNGDVYTIKPVDNQPVILDVCSKYIEIPYTIYGTSWAHNFVFTVKFQFD